MDAIIISDAGNDTFSASSPLRLKLDGKVASLQNVRNFLAHEGAIVEPVEGERENNWHTAPKLNGIRLYSYLYSEGFHVALIDSFYEEKRRFIDLLQSKPKSVIISTTFITSKDELKGLVQDIRRLVPHAVIIAGGPFVLSSWLLLQRASEDGYDVSSPKEDYLFLSNKNRPDVDLYIIDKGGEQILAESLNRIRRADNLNELPNTAWWNGSGYTFNSRTELPPTPMKVDWENLPDEFFRSGVLNIQASMGCPYNCQFCNFVKDRRHMFVKPLEQLIDELKTVTARGIKYVRFVDDNFRLGQQDLNTVCEKFLEAGLNLKWMSFFRASTLDQTDLNLLKESGCMEVQIGIESGDMQVLKNMKKNADPDMYFRVISRLLSIGINCSSCFIVGFPGETEASFNQTINFIDSLSREEQQGLYFWSIYPFLLAPLSPIYEPKNRERYNLRGYMNQWEHSTMNSEQAYELVRHAFLRIRNGVPIYSGDNMEMLMQLSLEKRKKFMQTRHELSKKFLKEPFDRTLAVRSFSEILNK